MTRVGKCAAPILTWFSICVLTPHFLRAQKITEEVVLSAVTSPYTGTTLTSKVKAVLFDDQNQRLFSQLILGHVIKDLTSQTNIYEKRLVSEIGDASETATTTGIVPHCYETDMAVHVNAFNYHRVYTFGPVCAEPYEPQPRPVVEVPEENCPVLLDLQQDGFHLSGPNPGVRFDIDADGIPDEIAWTKAGEDDAFLCWDRNRNGVIDDGRELFGFSTPLMSGGQAKVGYRALAEIDQPELGGNRDGKVDANDEMFRSLCAWVDGNQDGVSQPAEIHTLEEVGVMALGYLYKPMRLRDSFGNLFRYVSSAEIRSRSGLVRSWPTFDVIFAEVADH